MRALLARVPLRVRVTIAFAGVSAVVLVALGLFLHARLRSELDESLNAGLRQRLSDVTTLVASGGASGLGHGSLIERGDDIAQVLDARGRIVAGAPGFAAQPLLSRAELRRALNATVSAEHDGPGDDGPLALLAGPAGAQVAVVGASLEDRDDALDSLDALLWVGIPIALLLAGGAGFLVAGSALKPIERLRARAEAIGAQDLGERLPVPAAQDEVRRLAETLNGLLARLERAFARERAFVADASHELRTPLTRLKAELELASRNGRSVGELEAAVRSAAGETDRLVLLAEDLLVLARADQGRLPLRRTRVDVGELLEDARRRHAPDALVEAPEGLVVHADRLRLEQALANLVDNALRHGGGRVTLVAERERADVVLRVRDEGRGLPPEIRDSAFERFTRGDPIRDPDGGAGLGLAIVAAIADAHGGEAGIGDGPASELWLRLPA